LVRQIEAGHTAWNDGIAGLTGGEEKDLLLTAKTMQQIYLFDRFTYQAVES
jgi:hypothetical protein